MFSRGFIEAFQLIFQSGRVGQPAVHMSVMTNMNFLRINPYGGQSIFCIVRKQGCIANCLKASPEVIIAAVLVVASLLKAANIEQPFVKTVSLALRAGKQIVKLSILQNKHDVCRSNLTPKHENSTKSI